VRKRYRTSHAVLNLDLANPRNQEMNHQFVSMRPGTLLAATLICVSGCRKELSYPPPPQRAKMIHHVSAVIGMAGTRPYQLWGSIVSGVLPAAPDADWRWVSTHPEFRFKIDRSMHWKFVVGITAARVALDRVGSQHATFRINGRVAGSATLDREGRFDFEFPAEPASLALAYPQTVSMDFDPCIAQAPNPPLCVLLHSVGFVQEQP
jgi:hypothetical protein